MVKLATPVDLTIEGFAVSVDSETCRVIQAVPLLTKAVECLQSVWITPQIRAQMLGNGVRISHEQLPSIYEPLEAGARRLGVKCPELYVKQDPTYNAQTLGTNEDAIIVVNSGLLDALEIDELAFLLCHELGHVKCRHVTYSTIVYSILSAIGPFAGALAYPLLAPLDAWQRQAEFTADRAGLIGCLDIAASIRALVMMALGSRKLLPEFEFPSYLSQVRELDGFWGHFSQWIGFQDHPHLAFRVRSLLEFAKTSQYRSIIQKFNLDLYCDRRRPLYVRGGGINGNGKSGKSFCKNCGFELDSSSQMCAVCGRGN
jgi:Zn-dependent protease with chaperone function